MKIENKKICVTCSLKGAEITSIYDKELDIEYMHDANPASWAYHSPILFPVIGSSYNKKYHFNESEYTMDNHGIMRSAMFKLENLQEDKITLSFKSNEQSKLSYPFDFKMSVTYELIGQKVNISYLIENLGSVNMPFNFGLHPAFKCPLFENQTLEDYSIKFKPKVKLKGIGYGVDLDLIDEIKLSDDLFEKDPTLIYENMDVSYVELSDAQHGVRVSCVGYPIFAIWKPLKAPFVCLEPWMMKNKGIMEDLPFEKRDACRIIEGNHSYLTSYSIVVF